MRLIKRAMIILLAITLLLATAIFFFLRQPVFGKAPAGERLEHIKKSPNYKDGKFQNILFTPDLTEGYSMAGVMYDFLFKKFPRTNPVDKIPSVKTDLKNLPINENVLVWFGHSSYYIQLNGKRFLIDPVFSGNASPISGSNKAFNGTDVYTADDIPEIDFLLITHDHYDHLDYHTIVELKPKIKQIICGLGVGAHFEHWDYDPTLIIEKDWDEQVALTDDIMLHTASARHFSGRSLTRNNTLWLSFALITPEFKFYLGGDSGYGPHFAEIGNKFGGFDLAILENGQYNLAWQAIHLLPEVVLIAANELKAKRLFPVHSAKFKLANHPWDEPLNKVSVLNEKENSISLVTPIIGEVVSLSDSTQVFSKWWKDVK